VYSLAILLQEEGLYDRSRIYATDMNEVVLRKARSGIFPIDLMQKYAANYAASGGTAALSDYYTAAYDHVVLRQSLRDHVVFAQHNLATDGVFNEFNVILCRNVMIYFTAPLQARVHDLFARSFATFGLLGIGSHESLPVRAGGDEYTALTPGEKLFRRAH
jgi:chemotaxis protein methyltransferase CheR